MENKIEKQRQMTPAESRIDDAIQAEVKAGDYKPGTTYIVIFFEPGEPDPQTGEKKLGARWMHNTSSIIECMKSVRQLASRFLSEVVH